MTTLVIAETQSASADLLSQDPILPARSNNGRHADVGSSNRSETRREMKTGPGAHALPHVIARTVGPYSSVLNQFEFFAHNWWHLTRVRNFRWTASGHSTVQSKKNACYDASRQRITVTRAARWGFGPPHLRLRSMIKGGRRLWIGPDAPYWQRELRQRQRPPCRACLLSSR